MPCHQIVDDRYGEAGSPKVRRHSTFTAGGSEGGQAPTVRRAGTDNVLQLSAFNRRLSYLSARFSFSSRSELAKPFAGSETCPKDLEGTTEQRQEDQMKRTGSQTHGCL